MFKQIFRIKSVLFFLLIVSFLSSVSYAAEARRTEAQRPQGRKVAFQRSVGQRPASQRIYRHYYRDGQWYNRGLFGFDTPIAVLPIGTLVSSLPPQYATVMVQNVPYYSYGNTYYSQSPYGGYVVIQAPALI